MPVSISSLRRVGIAAVALALLPLPLLAQSTADAAITGAGSSAAAPVYRTWAAEFAKTAGTTLAYDPVGSSAGMARISKREVDFGASDVYASAAELKKSDLVMFPAVITGVVPVVNLPALPKGAPRELRLTGEVLARLFLGEIRQWDAPEIAALNPGVKLPALPVRLVARADGSGTTWHFTEYLSRLSPDWKRAHGTASKLDWPAGTIAAKGSAAVSEAVRGTPGALGYIDFNYVVDDKLSAVTLRNADGEFVAPAVSAFREAVMHSAWSARGDFAESIENAAGKGSWPITMGTFIALPRVAAQRERTERALRFVLWGYVHGDALARQARFVPLPEKVQASAYREIAKVADASGDPIGMKLMGTMLR